MGLTKRIKKKINTAGLSCDWIKKLPTKTLINVIFFSLMIFFASANAAEENWVFVSEREDDLWFVNTGTIMCIGNLCKASVKIQPHAEKYKYTIELNEYACMEMKYKTLRTTTYDSNRNIVKSITTERQGWNHIAPESVSKELYDFVCKEAYGHKEQLTKKKLVKKHEAEQPIDSTKKSQLQNAVSPEVVETQSATVEGKKETSLQSQRPSDTIFTVQVGAFKEASYVKALATRLYEKGYKVYVTYDARLFKVCIGKFSDREKANILSEKIKKTEGLQAVVTLSYD